MKALLCILLTLASLSALELKSGLLYTGWPESDSTIQGMIEITADSLASPERLPVQVIYLVDISRECAGSVRQGLIEGGKELITTLRDDDRFGIVLYSKFARTLMPLTNLNAEKRAEAIDLLNRITTEEGRDLSAALARVTSEFKQRAGEKIEGRYLVVSAVSPLSDGKKGNALLADFSAVKNIDTMGCIVHTVNYGETFDDLIAIRSAEQGNGRAYLAPKDLPDSLVGIFKNVAGAIASPLYRDLELFVEIPDSGATLCQFGTDVKLPNPIKIKQIARGKTERILFTLKNRPAGNSSIDFDLDYYDVASKNNLNQKNTLKLTLVKEPIYNTQVAGTIIRGSVLSNLADNFTMFRRVDTEMTPKDGKEFRRNYAFKFQQQVVNRLETVQSSVGTAEMDQTTRMMRQLFEEIRDGVYGTEYIIRHVEFELHNSLYGR